MSPVSCPVCQQELSSSRCPRCGYDESCQYERYPTLVFLPGEQQRPLSALRAAWLGDSVPTDQDPALLFQRALQSGSGAEQLELLSMAAFLGHPPAQALLGEKYLQQGKTELAVTLFRASAQQGNSSACYLLSRCYRDGTGVQRSDQHALSWLRQAAARGHIKACTELADKLLVGKELPRDLPKAEELYRRAALAGSPDGLVHLAKCYRDGAFAPPSPEKAAELLKEAGKHGSREASLLLADMGEKKPSPPPKSAGGQGASASSASAARGTAASGSAGSRSNAAGSRPEANAETPDPQADGRPYSRGRSYASDRYDPPRKSAETAARADDRRYSRGRTYEPDRYDRPGTGNGSSAGAAPRSAGTGAQSAAPTAAPAAASSALARKSLRSLKIRRVVDVLLVLYLITLALCAFGDAFGTEASIPAGLTFCFFAWLLFRRCRTLTRAIKAKTAQNNGQQP